MGEKVNMLLSEKIFIRLANLGIFIGCVTRAVGYSDILGEPRESPGPQILSDDGQWLWIYALMWGAAAVFALIDLVRGKIGTAVVLFIVLLGWWALSYFLAWQTAHYRSWDWLSVGIYAASMLTITGLLGALVAARRKNQRLLEQTMPREAIQHE